VPCNVLCHLLHCCRCCCRALPPSLLVDVVCQALWRAAARRGRQVLALRLWDQQQQRLLLLLLLLLILILILLLLLLL
jgi:hypothetical protein